MKLFSFFNESFQHYTVKHKPSGKTYKVTALSQASAKTKAAVQHGGRSASAFSGTSDDQFEIEEGKSPHKKGTAKYKKHMAAMHAEEVEVDEVAGAKDCWDGYKKDGTQAGTGKNKGKRVNKCVKEMDQDDVDLGPTWEDDLEAALDGYPEHLHDTIKDGVCPECSGNGYMDGDYENEAGEENDECSGMYNYDCDEGEIRDNTWADELKRKEPKQPAPSKEQIMKILPRLHDDYVKTGRYNAFALTDILKQMYPELNKREASGYVADFLSNFKESEELNDLRKRAGLEEVSDFKRRELEYELRDEEPNRDSKKRRPYRTPQEKIRDAKKRYSKAVGVMKGNTDEGIEEAEGDKCEICNGRGKIDYHSEDGPSKCQKCNGKGVQAWKPEPVNWGKVKEDDLRKRAGIEVNESNGTPLKDIFPNLDTNKDKYKGHLLQAIGSHVRNNFPDGGRGEWRKLLTSLLTMRSSEGFGRIYPHHFTMLDKAVDSLEAEIKRRPEIEKQKAKDRAEREKKHRERIKAEIKRRRREGEMTEEKELTDLRKRAGLEVRAGR